jgi:hypothetical protein
VQQQEVTQETEGACIQQGEQQQQQQEQQQAPIAQASGIQQLQQQQAASRSTNKQRRQKQQKQAASSSKGRVTARTSAVFDIPDDTPAAVAEAAAATESAGLLGSYSTQSAGAAVIVRAVCSEPMDRWVLLLP